MAPDCGPIVSSGDGRGDADQPALHFIRVHPLGVDPLDAPGARPSPKWNISNTPPEKSASERYAWGVCLLPIALYGAHVVGLLWTEDMELGRFQLESKLALLVTPWLVWESVRDQNDEQKRRLWIRMGWAFVAGWGVHMIWVWSRFLGFYFRHELPLPWRYSKLATPFHPSYAAFYLIWAGMFLVALTAHHRRWMRLFLIPLGGHLGLLASKAGWLVGGGCSWDLRVSSENGDMGCSWGVRYWCLWERDFLRAQNALQNG